MSSRKTKVKQQYTTTFNKYWNIEVFKFLIFLLLMWNSFSRHSAYTHTDRQIDRQIRKAGTQIKSNENITSSVKVII